MWKIAKYNLYDIVHNKIVLSYAVFLLIISISLFVLDGDPSRSLISLMSVILIVVPLISMVFSTIFLYNNYEFIELLATQPVKRAYILLANYTGVAGSLSCAYAAGVGIPVLIYAPGATGAVLIIAGIALTLIFTSLSFLVTMSTRDKARGIGMALLLWFVFSIIYDGLIITVLFFFSDYPLEKVVLVVSSLNPVDLARISILLKMDISALMGYTGAVFKDFFGTAMGTAVTSLLMAAWAVLPLVAAVRTFLKKDL